MINYYSSDRTRQLRQQGQLQQQQQQQISPMIPSSSINIGESSSNSNSNSSNRVNGGSSGFLQQQSSYNQNMIQHKPMKPQKFKISYSVSNTIENVSIQDKHCFGVNSICYDYSNSIFYSAGRDSTIKSYYDKSSSNSSNSNTGKKSIKTSADVDDIDDDDDGDDKEEQDDKKEKEFKQQTCTLNNNNNNKMKFKKSYEDHTDWVNDIFISEKDQIMVSCSSDTTIKIWNTDSEECIRTLKKHDDYVKVLSYSPKVNYFASAGLDSHILVWDLNICAMTTTLLNNNSNCNSINNDQSSTTTPSSSSNSTPITLSNNRNNKSNSSSNGVIDNNVDQEQQQDDDNNKDLSTSPSSPPPNNSNNGISPMFKKNSILTGAAGGEGISIYSLALSEDANMVLSGSTERAIRCWDLRNGQMSFKLKGHTDNVRSIILSPDCKRLISASSDGTFRLWDIGQQSCIQVFDDLFNDSVWSLEANSCFSHVFSGGRDGSIFMTDLSTFNSILVCKEQDSILSMLHNDRDKSLWVSTTDPTIKNYNITEIYDKNNFINSSNSNNSNNSNNDFNFNFNNHLNIHQQQQQQQPQKEQLKCISDEQCNSVDIVIQEADITIPGRPGIIKNLVLNNRREVLTKDNSGCVQLWDVTQGKEIKSFGSNVDFDQVAQEINEIISIPKWFTTDTKTGSLFICLESPQCFQADANLSNVGFTFRSTEDDISINLGESIIQSLFTFWYKKRQLIYNNILSNSLDNSNNIDNDKKKNINNNQNNNSQNNKNKGKLIFDLPKNTEIVISEETKGTIRLRSKIDQFTGNESYDAIPRWVPDCFEGNYPKKETQKHPFYLSPNPDEKNISPLPKHNLRHFAPPNLQIRRICYHIAHNLGLDMNNNSNNNNHQNDNNNNGLKNHENILPTPDEMIEILCNSKVMSNNYTLATVKSFFWKSSEDLQLYYRIKQKYGNENDIKRILNNLNSDQINNSNSNSKKGNGNNSVNNSSPNLPASSVKDNHHTLLTNQNLPNI
ncbi:hypothetical protein CYY_002368 [Polysphondylium violaceum]|uniref:WD40 repeat-containing protein n=1 Tax=Polysphondylium violaceum TaxID=133409 RepID=A0A8J4Q0A3_9MYCE|nr:hypothetical protein CYY_002368 [Polysphondylium violaceum]